MVIIRVYVAMVRKFVKPSFNTDIKKYFLSNRVIDRWNSLDQDTVDATVSKID